MSKDKLYMDEAYKAAENSVARRLKVGACVVVPQVGIFITGYNHMPKGYNPECDFEVEDFDISGEVVKGLESYPNVIHAEVDVILSAAKIGFALNNSVMYLTDSPCLRCAELIASSGIKKVVYDRKYRITEGLDYLEQQGIEVVKYNNN